MKIGFDFTKGEIITDNNYSKPFDENECEILEQIIKMLSNNFESTNFKIVKNCKDYTTLQYKMIDIVRIKYTDRAKWITISMADNDCARENINNPLFNNEKNKNKAHWKSSLKDSNNISVYLPFLIKSCKQIDEFNN